MGEALREALIGRKENEVPVGAVIISGKGLILARAHNQTIRNHDPCAHAEILAIRRACAKTGSTVLKDCALIVTLEPCLMCAGAIALSRLGCVVFGAWDAREGAMISRNDFINLPVKSRNFWFLGGVSSDLCKNILESFFRSLR